MRKPLIFFFHFNKPASASAGKPQISVHFQKKCYIVDNIDCKVPVTGAINKKQPLFVMKGKVHPDHFKIHNNIAYLD